MHLLRAADQPIASCWYSFEAALHWLTIAARSDSHGATDRDLLLTNVSLYCFTGTAGSSANLSSRSSSICRPQVFCRWFGPHNLTRRRRKLRHYPHKSHTKACGGAARLRHYRQRASVLHEADPVQGRPRMDRQPVKAVSPLGVPKPVGPP